MNLLGVRCVRCCFVSLEYELECVCRARPPRVRQSEDCGSAMITDGPRLPKQAERINTVARAALSRSAPTWATPSSHFTPNSHPVIGEDLCMDRIMYTPWTLGFCGHPHVLVSVSFLQFGETLTRIEWFCYFWPLTSDGVLASLLEKIITYERDACQWYQANHIFCTA